MSKQPSSSFEVFTTINFLHHIKPSKEHSQFLRSLQAKPKSTSKASPPRAIPEQSPCCERIAL